ncbi:MAG: ABC transporter ATP-binding protein [SAR202 cluster bacterium]|nr:MAG: ABC transporter ATP-binding protein [SAR202 cluster bacterium]MBH38836.1 peptide ABC transporter ATP-binding protein [Chloroflexota bacterium]MQG81351.1 ABC transporter ATP-binding protein [SAR202 cluster bacterium]
MSPLLEVKNLRTHFYTFEGVVKAVDGVSYDLEEGETLGLVGESGCGKSVSAMSLMRLIPDPPGKIVDGEILFEGQDVLQLSMDEMRHIRGAKMSMVFQEPMTSLNPVLNLEKQLGETLQLHKGMTKQEARQESVELLARVGIPDPERRVRQYPHQFSGGMRQRVMIAMALSCNPRVIIADEPTTALDVTIQAQILELMKGLTQEFGVAMIVITHNLGVVARYADRMNIMYAGKIIERGESAEIYSNPRHPYTVGLLKSVPRLDLPRRTRLDPIEGQPPDLIAVPKGCAFRERCKWAVDKCATEEPGLESVAEGHYSACWRSEDLGPGALDFLNE